MTELERIIQVEEIWARRRVLNEINNLKRLKAYQTRRAGASTEEYRSPSWDNIFPFQHKALKYEDIENWDTDAF
jgi:hypothetical protein